VILPECGGVAVGSASPPASRCGAFCIGIFRILIWPQTGFLNLSWSTTSDKVLMVVYVSGQPYVAERIPPLNFRPDLMDIRIIMED
jgi:hypothetical protein